MIRIHVFCKHPRKLEIKSDGDISDGAFYRPPVKNFYKSFDFMIGGEFSAVNENKNKRFCISKTGFYDTKQHFLITCSLLTTCPLDNSLI